MGQSTRGASLSRCSLVLLAATVGAVCVVTPLLPDLLALVRAIGTGAVSRDPFDDVLVQVCQVALAGCVAWGWLATAVVAADAVRGRQPRHHGVPRVLGRVVLAACGAALVGGLGAPAHAGDGPDTSPLEGLRLPDRATATTHVSRVFARAASPERRTTPARRDQSVVIRPGDTLWALARAVLPPGAGPDAVARRVREIHQDNRSVIGANPDLIRPGQRLRLPRPTTIREEHR